MPSIDITDKVVHAVVGVSAQTGLATGMEVADQNVNGFDPSTGRTPVEQTNNYASLAINATSNGTIKAAPGFVHKIIFKAATAFQVTLYDDPSTTNNVIFTSGAIPATSTVPVVVELNALFTSGLTLRNNSGVNIAAGDVVVIYR